MRGSKKRISRKRKDITRKERRTKKKIKGNGKKGN